MKPFDLQDALNGAPVLLRNGCKAFVVQDIRKTFDQYELHCPETIYPLLIICDWAYWRATADGKEYRDFCINTKDIIGMWEEPELTSEQVLEKAYQEGLMVRFDDGFEYPVIGKARGGSYLLGDEHNTYIMWCKDFGKPEICREDTAEPSPKSDTITVTLPKPFKPKEGEVYYSIGGYHNGTIVKMHANCMTDISILSGNCFRTESDAQAWLDAMKSALDD